MSARVTKYVPAELDIDRPEVMKVDDRELPVGDKCVVQKGHIV
jgi:hypothetical protein